MTTEVDNSPQARNRRESRVGTVVSDKADKTITVRFDFIVKHPKYGKYYKRSTKLRTHDEDNTAKNGDIVEVMSCRKISKSKCWRLTKVVRALS